MKPRQFSVKLQSSAVEFAAWVLVLGAQQEVQQQCSSATCLLETITAVLLATVLFQQFVNQAGCFQLVEHLHAFAEAFLGQLLDVVLVELVLIDDLDNEVALLVGAVPHVLAVAARGSAATVGVTVAGTALSGAVPVWQVAEILNGRIDRVLEFLVETRGFLLDFAQVSDFASERDAKLVGGVAGEADLLL